MKLSSVAPLDIVKMITSSADNSENLVKMTISVKGPDRPETVQPQYTYTHTVTPREL